MEKNETTEQMKARWAREQVADRAAVSLGLARQTKQRGIMYWTGNGEQFRTGYWAGREETQAIAVLTTVALGKPPKAITASLMIDDGGERPAYCVMAAYSSEADARAALATLSAAPAEAQAEQVALQMCSELKPRSESEKAAYLAGVADGRMYAERDADTAPKAQPADAPIAYLQQSDQHLLHRFIETTEDDESFDIGKDAVKRLANLGVVESCGFGRYGVTMFGYWVHEHYWHQNPSLPLKTNADRDREHRAAMAAAQEGGKA
ncbi:hypothetical protein [Comamonas koreensis]|uniref:hypothetical protein n=1 Tax=Comamonas koreensis TaxID=160825 RepID=UPI0015F977FC|nr:hypothetical protein [Comamonas koreensis]